MTILAVAATEVTKASGEGSERVLWLFSDGLVEGLGALAKHGHFGSYVRLAKAGLVDVLADLGPAVSLGDSVGRHVTSRARLLEQGASAIVVADHFWLLPRDAAAARSVDYLGALSFDRISNLLEAVGAAREDECQIVHPGSSVGFVTELADGRSKFRCGKLLANSVSVGAAHCCGVVVSWLL